MRFEKLDQNGDGKITLPEMSGRVNQRFARLDKNQDGEITREEARFGKHHGKHPARHPARHYGKRRFEKRDVNGDGQLSRDEIPRMPDKKFAKLDRNQDGQLSPSELRPGGKAKKHRRFAKIDTDGFRRGFWVKNVEQHESECVRVIGGGVPPQELRLEIVEDRGDFFEEAAVVAQLAKRFLNTTERPSGGAQLAGYRQRCESPRKAL